jgi:hypothetical protein
MASTAIDLSLMDSGVEVSVSVAALFFDDVVVDSGRTNWNTISPAATTARKATIAVSFRPVLRVIDWLGETSSARTIPSGVISKAHANTTANGKPRVRAAIKIFIVHVGASKVGRMMEAAWISSQATTAYATATL